MHDFHPPISASGLFWTVRVPEACCTFAADGSSASVDVRDLSIIDQPAFPDRAGTVAGTLSHMRVTWTATSRAARIADAGKHFAFEGHEATAHMEFAVTIPSTGFAFASGPLATSGARFAIVGSESNGQYVASVMPDLVGLTETQALALLGNASRTKVTTEVLGHESLGNAFRHDLTTSVVTATEPSAGSMVGVDRPIVLRVR